ncbi:MAG: DUF3822 family protein [Cyclobacteriaceae bacterium]|nr:DUF3822 family protein [Cyclobacteriaceae bacterium]
MAISSIQFKLLRKEKDPKFDIDNLEHYNLLLQVGFSDIQVCITDSRKNKIMLLEDYIMPGVISHEERVDILECLFDDHHLLLAGFWNRIKVMVKNRKFSLVPSALFQHENVQDYINLNTQVDQASENFFYRGNESMGLTNTFAVNKEVTRFLTQQTYPHKEVQFYHQSSSFIEGFQKYFAGMSGNVVAIYLDRFRLHVAYFRDGIFKFYNQYPVKTFDDYYRYIGFVVDEFSVDPHQDQFYIWGYLHRSSKHFNTLKSKYPTLITGERPADLSMSYVFDEIADHQYFDLLSFNHLS